MEILVPFAIVALAALIHASFQLSVSVLTLLGGHSIGARMSKKKTLRLISSFVFGVCVATLLLVSFTSLIFLHSFGTEVPLVAWAVVCGVVLGVGVAVWLFYYRKGKSGTSLWIPRSFARHLNQRSRQTGRSIEAFSLGLTSVFTEIVFIIPTIALAALTLIGLHGAWQLLGLALYSVISLSGLLIVWALIASGRSLSRVQKWRESNKRFLQFSAGSALMVLGFYVYVTQVISTTAGAGL